MSFSVTKSIDKTTLPVKGDAMVTVTLTMASELAANPRDILIAWDYFGEDVDSVYLRDTDGALRGMLESLVGVTGGSNGKLGNGNRVALYGNRANAGEVRTALTDDTAVLLAELDAAKAAPPTGLALSADSMVEMLAGAANRKTVLICGLRKETALVTAERDKLTAAGIEIFTMGAIRIKDTEPWGGLANSSSDGQGPAMSMAGLPQNLVVEEYLGYQFRAKLPMEATLGEPIYNSPAIGRPYRMTWEVGLPAATTAPQTHTMTYRAVNLGPELGEQTVSTLHVVPNDIHSGSIGEEVTGLPVPVLTVNVTADPASGGGTDPDPTPGGGTDPDPTPGNDIVAENWPAPQEITVGHCKDAVQATVPDAQLVSLGRLVQLDVVLKNICPGKRVSATVLLTDTNADGLEETRAMKHILVPAQTGTACADVTLRCIQFSVPEALDLSGDPTSLCNERKFNVRIIANYVDSDMILCGTSTATV